MKLLPPYFSARQIVYAECHTYANIFLCTPRIYQAYAFVYAIPPLPIALGIYYLFQLRNFLHDRHRKIP